MGKVKFPSSSSALRRAECRCGASDKAVLSAPPLGDKDILVAYQRLHAEDSKQRLLVFKTNAGARCRIAAHSLGLVIVD